MTNEELVIRIKAGIDPAENMLALYEQVKAFIHSVAWKHRGQEEVEDLEQEGYLALYDAIDGYDLEAGCKFLTYAEYWIKQRIMRYIERNSCCLRLSFHSQARLRQYKRYCDSFMKKHGREPSEAETAAQMVLSIDQVREVHKNACMANLGSLDAPVKGFEEEGFTVGDSVPSGEDMEGDALDQLKAVLWECMDSQPGRQPEVIRKQYQDNMTMAEIGREYGVSREAIRQDQAKALRELRKPKKSERLRPFLPEDERIYSMGLSGNGVGRFNQTWTSSTERAVIVREELAERMEEHKRWLEEVREELRRSQQARRERRAAQEG
ncbi:sigma-70 family RNA polymerase sigma factor [Clostridium sp. Marseille-P2415]|uniref:sigma-70 family RNA polymerase sigma factor n=1 Tax=Clostridium sp. Marseille-P2415 TaxID=1805471 RepID=UPI00098869E1|nr:sigma-70 family RNA polymerase sigma factor [Clostridium sp. Marseille-P2415]